MTYKINSDKIEEEDIQEYIKMQHHYYTFDYKLEYKKLQRRMEDGPLDARTEIPDYFLKSRELFSFPMQTKSNTYWKMARQTKSTDMPGIKKMIASAEANMLEYIKENNSNIAVVTYKMDCDKIFDGRNGHWIKMRADTYELKDSGAVDRGARQQIKNIINGAFNQDYLKWTHHNRSTLQAMSNVLPSRLLKDLLEDKITWREFCTRLQNVRTPKKEEVC